MKLNELIPDKDIKIVVTKGSGSGGQHRNKVETHVTATHTPSGLKQTCCQTPSKLQNVKLAKKWLRVKVYNLVLSKKKEALNEERKKQFGKRIRTYHFPTKTVRNDLNGKTAPLKDVLNGRLDLIQ